MKDIIRMNRLAGIITEGQAAKMIKILNEEENLNTSDVKNSDDTITLTKDELETFIKDWDQGYGSWSDTSGRIVRFLGMDETDGL
jgi:hypothetical protein